MGLKDGGGCFMKTLSFGYLSSVIKLVGNRVNLMQNSYLKRVLRYPHVVSSTSTIQKPLSTKTLWIAESLWTLFYRVFCVYVMRLACAHVPEKSVLTSLLKNFMKFVKNPLATTVPIIVYITHCAIFHAITVPKLIYITQSVTNNRAMQEPCQ